MLYPVVLPGLFYSAIALLYYVTFPLYWPIYVIYRVNFIKDETKLEDLKFYVFGWTNFPGARSFFQFVKLRFAIRFVGIVYNIWLEILCLFQKDDSAEDD